MQLNKFFSKFFLISREYKFFAFLITLSICSTYGFLAFIAYQNHKNTYQQKYLSLVFSIANSQEIFLDNIFRQAEFIGQKILSTKQQIPVQDLLKNNFSLNTNLDMSLISSWVKFEWIDGNDPRTNSFELRQSKSKPWLIHFEQLHTTGPDMEDHFIPVSFGITNKEGEFLGTLVSNISVVQMLKFLQRNIDKKQLSILVLDQDNHIIGQTTNEKMSLPEDFFRDKYFFNPYDNLYQKSEFSDLIYLSYKKLDSYPFTIVIGDNENVIFAPITRTFFIYLSVFFITLVVSLMILLSFYKKIITPIISLSSFAKDIISSRKTSYTPDHHSFIEIVNLEEALIKIGKYKKELHNSNQKLKRRTIELENTKKILEEDLEKLSSSYKLRDNLLKKSAEKKTKDIVATDVIKQCLTSLYAEIYSRQIKIIESLAEVPKLDIKYQDLVKIAVGLLSRSFIFSKKGTQVTVSVETKDIDENSYFCLTITDNGIGNEEWRRKSLEDDGEFENLELITKENFGILECVNLENSGVKYILLLPYKNNNKGIQKKEHIGKLIVFPNNKTK